MNNDKLMPFKITIGGNEVEAFVKEDDFKKVIDIVNQNNKKTGYERCGMNSGYCFVNSDGNVTEYLETYDITDTFHYEVANYYSNRTVAENNARADKLMRQLRRFAVEHRENKLDWQNRSKSKYYIYYDYICETLKVDYTVNARDLCCVYFNSKDCAYDVVETFRDELIWYFTEYKDSL